VNLPFTLSPAAIRYTWRELMRRAGGDNDTLPVAFSYGECSTSHEGPMVVVTPCVSTAWRRLVALDPGQLHWRACADAVPAGARLPLRDAIPVLLWGSGAEDGDKPFAELRNDTTVVFHADIVASTLFMLSRWEETVVTVRDKHRRFPATASVAYKQGFLDRPVVDEYALVLREWLKALLPRWQPNPPPFTVKLSHDIDRIRRFRHSYMAIPSFAVDLLKRRSPSRAWQTIVELVAQTMAPDRTFYFRGIGTLAHLSQKYGMGDDAFYFMAAQPGPLEGDYDPASPLIKRCIADLQAQGFEIGLHAGYHTLNDPLRLAHEKARLDAILGEKHYGGRQHNLRFQVPNTWRHWEQVGLSYDSTMTYADHEGFRCGTCHRFRPFDLEQDRELHLWEYPLIVMEGTLRDYRNLTPEQGEARIVELAQRCMVVHGTFTLLWHNASFDWEWRPWTDVYEHVLRDSR
jgi:hypothetical protein